MKRYGFLKCWPAGMFSSGNECLAECEANSVAEAAAIFTADFGIRLDVNGYAKTGDISYTVAECWNPFPKGEYVKVHSKPCGCML